MATLQKIQPNLWFNGNAEQAVNFYVNVFKNSSVGDKTYYGKAGYEYHKIPEGTVLTIEFTIEGLEFVALNAGPEFTFNESISFVINCDTQEEIDYYWHKLSAGGSEQECGWLKDKFGVSWQVTPRILQKMIMDKDREKVERVLNAMFPMKKLNIRTFEQAYNGNA